MKKLFYAGICCLTLFEILNVYFIMPMPGSQRMDSIHLAYFLYSWRWPLRIIFLACIIAGSPFVFKSKYWWMAGLSLVLTGVVAGLFNFKLSADKMFLQPRQVIMRDQTQNELPGSRLVIGVQNNGEAKAYPISFLAYHHQVLDQIGNEPVIVTYCSVCRTGRAYRPMVRGQLETFRLVGMDHFNAMFEDETTHSWWRQVSGEAIVGELKGERLPELETWQLSLNQWFSLFPEGLVMQLDSSFSDHYDPDAKFERGLSEGDLTKRDSASWHEKSWVIGIETDEAAKAFDWNRLVEECIINDQVGSTPVVLALADDGVSFVAYERPEGKLFTLEDGKLLKTDSIRYGFTGQNLKYPADRLNRVKASQEFWHSWLSFHPGTDTFR